MNNNLTIVIMAGGRGTRLWPLSTIAKPKQFQAVTGEDTMLKATYDRFASRYDAAQIYVSTNTDYIEAVKESLPGFPEGQIIAEPCSRNTASCIALVAGVIEQDQPGAQVMVVPSDHVIHNPETLLDAIEVAGGYMSDHDQKIITFGIMPTYPESGYGYIKQGDLLIQEEGTQIYDVAAFVEKPSVTVAKEYLGHGGYYWNAGMFMFNATQMLEKMSKHIPATVQLLNAILDTRGKDHYQSTLESEYAKMDDVSIDYAIMEKDAEIALIPVALAWSDVGSWAALKEAMVEDKHESLVRADHIDHNSENLIVFGSTKPIVTIGLKNLAIIDTEEALLVCNQDDSQEVSPVVKGMGDAYKHLR